jgi:hypothetical protein
VRWYTTVQAALPLYPRGPRSDRVMLSRPSTLNRPHAPRSPAHLDFTFKAYTKCPRCASLLRRLGDPRVVPRFHCIVPSQHVALCVPGEAIAAYTQFLRASIGLRRELPTARPSQRYPISGLIGSPLLRPAELLASLSETFTSGLAAVWSPSPPPDITTVPTGQFAPAELSSAGTAASVAARALFGSWAIPVELALG